MKNYFILSLISILFLASCQNEPQRNLNDLLANGSVAELDAKRTQLQQSADSLNRIIKILGDTIALRDPQRPRSVLTQVVRDSVYHHFIKIQSSIQTDQDVQVSPDYAGVLNLRVREGQHVSRGQLIGTVSDGGLGDQVNQARIQVDQARAQLQQAEIQADLAKTTYERQTNLWNQKIGSEMQWLQAKTNYETALKQVAAARTQVSAAQRGVSGSQAQLARTNIYAPFSGRVEQVITQHGQAVSPGMPIIRLVNTANLKAVAQVPEAYVTQISNGTKAVVNLPTLNKSIDSRVNRVSAAIDPGNRTFQVEVPVSGENLKPNLNAEILLNDYTNEKAIVVSESVLHEDAEGKFVFVADQVQNGIGVAKKVRVQTGTESNGFVEVLEGLQNGQIIITETPGRLQEGDRVEISN